MINWEVIHDDVHWLSDGIVNIVQSFTGNTLSVTIEASEYKDNQQIIGWLYLYSGFTEKRYALVTFDEVIALVLPECDRIEFRPTKFLSDTFGLKLAIATVDNGSNANNASVSIPAIILGLPDRVASLEGVEPPNFTSQFTGIDNRLDILESIPVVNFAPDILSINNRLGALESVPIPSFNTVVLEANSTLQSYKSYFAGVANLAVSLPVNPAIGDTIELFTGNYDLRVLHGNASQSIINSSTQTTMGVSSGILLKPYSNIKLLLVSTNLWISTIRVRSINNWLAVGSIEPTATAKAYTVEALEAYVYHNAANDLPKINDGSLSNGVMKVSGGTLNKFTIKIQFANSTILTRFQVDGGQFNGGFNAPNRVDLYSGETVNSNNLIVAIGNYPFIVNVPVNNQVLSQFYVFDFFGDSNNISIVELATTGRSSTGGEVSVI